jgi:signal transduction histidine kinase
MNNILKHAQATKVEINLRKEIGKIFFEITDNGIGFKENIELSNSGLGIRGMRERATQMGGNLSFENIPEGGTLLIVEVPDVGKN